MLDVSTVSVAQFKAQFFRDFPYLAAITYDPIQLYNTGNKVYYPTTLLFYCALIDGLTGVAPDATTNPPSWQQAPDDIANYIQDQDITNAFAEASVLFNPALFGSDANQLLGFLYLAAHFLCNDIRAALAGIAATGSFPVSARTVGSVSESYQIPTAYLDNPNFAFYTTSAYGMKYLQLVLPGLVGNMVGVYGGTNP